MSQANASKSEGNQLYAARKYDEALLCYKTALEVAPEEESSKEIRSMCYSNSAMCYLQLVNLSYLNASFLWISFDCNQVLY